MKIIDYVTADSSSVGETRNECRILMRKLQLLGKANC